MTGVLNGKKPRERRSGTEPNEGGRVGAEEKRCVYAPFFGELQVRKSGHSEDGCFCREETGVMRSAIPRCFELVT